MSPLAGDRPEQPAQRRAGFYIDGFNLYHAIDKLKQPHLKWVDYRGLANCLAPRGEDVSLIKLFTARPNHFPRSAANFDLFAAVCKARSIECILGKFKEKEVSCFSCKNTWMSHEEKESDVSLALHLLNDAKDGLIEVAYLVTCDTDLAPAVRLVRQFCPHIELVHVAVPGSSYARSIANHCHRHRKIERGHLEACLLPEALSIAGGKVIRRPEEYRPPS